MPAATRDLTPASLQGFISFSNRGEPDRLGVDELNERLAVKGRLRLRHSMKPDEGYGAIFFFDGVICNTQAIKQQAWREVAQRRGVGSCQIHPSEQQACCHKHVSCGNVLAGVWSCYKHLWTGYSRNWRGGGLPGLQVWSSEMSICAALNCTLAHTIVQANASIVHANASMASQGRGSRVCVQASTSHPLKGHKCTQ